MSPRDEFEANPFAAPETDLTAEENQTGEAYVYAGFWQRFLAAFLDGIIVQIIAIAGGAVLGGILGAARQQDIAGAVGGLFGLLVDWLYGALQESSEARATLGKRALGIVVVDLNGERISFGRATGRHFGKLVSSMICLVGFLMQPFTEKKQALHDIMAGTLVVKTQR